MTLLRHREYGTFKTVPAPAEAASLDDIVKPMGFDDAMVTVWENGHLLQDWSFARVRGRANAARPARRFPSPITVGAADAVRHATPHSRAPARLLKENRHVWFPL